MCKQETKVLNISYSLLLLRYHYKRYMHYVMKTYQPRRLTQVMREEIINVLPVYEEVDSARRAAELAAQEVESLVHCNKYLLLFR